MTDAQSTLAVEMRDLGKEVPLLRAQGKEQEAIRKLEGFVAITRELWGETSTSMDVLPALAILYQNVGRYEDALAVLTFIENLPPNVIKLPPAELAANKRLRSQLLKIVAMSPTDRERYQDERRLTTEAAALHLRGEYAKALVFSREAAELNKSLFGEDSAPYALAMNNLAAITINVGDSREAGILAAKAVQLLTTSIGEKDQITLTALSNLAFMYQRTKGPARELELRQKVVDLSREVYAEGNVPVGHMVSLVEALWRNGDREQAKNLLAQQVDRIHKDLADHIADPRDEAVVFDAVADIAVQEGNLAMASSAARTSALAAAKANGAESTPFAASAGDVATIYLLMGDVERAEPLARECVRILEKTVGPDHPICVSNQTLLTRIHIYRGEFDKAKVLLDHAIAVSQKAYGDQHLVTSGYREMLALMYLQNNQPAEALPLLSATEQTIATTSGDNSSERGDNLQLQARGLLMSGDLPAAEAKQREAIRLQGLSEGAKHVNAANKHQLLARILAAQSKAAEALTELSTAIDINEIFFRDTFTGQSERQRIETLAARRGSLDWWLSLSAGEQDSTLTYQRVLRWKGAVASHTTHARVAEQQPQWAPQVKKVNLLRTRYAALAFAPPPADQRELWQKELQQLRDEKEDAEAELARASKENSLTPSLEPQSAEILTALPSGTVFVDFLRYEKCDPKSRQFAAGGETHYVAFVLRSGNGVQRVELGAAKTIELEVDSWRAALQSGDDAKLRTANDALWNSLLKPLSPQLRGGGALVVSLDGALNRLPLAALRPPGSDAYLIESRAIAVVPSARQVVELFSLNRANVIPPSFLAVGGVEYPDQTEPIENAPAPAPIFAAALKNLSPLPGTLLETDQAAAVYRRSFAKENVVLLAGKDASERRVATELAKKPRFVHLATHGFFAPAMMRSALGDNRSAASLTEESRGVSPWLLSGLVLAPESNAADMPADGVLTAEELNALDLSGIDLVVLSACETGLGDVAGGEGVLGLQRGFHVAGVRTVVTSLWKVDDAATSLLMQAFYENLWTKKLPKLEAMRQAQLSLLKTPTALQKRRDLLVQQFAQRGITLEDAPAKPLPLSSESDRTHPRYWAAFVLSGDAFNTAAPGAAP